MSGWVGGWVGGWWFNASVLRISEYNVEYHDWYRHRKPNMPGI